MSLYNDDTEDRSTCLLVVAKTSVSKGLTIVEELNRFQTGQEIYFIETKTNKGTKIFIPLGHNKYIYGNRIEDEINK